MTFASPVPVARFSDLPLVPLNSVISPSTDVAVLVDASPPPVPAPMVARTVIYETNLQQSYNAGREAQMNDPAVRKRRPYGLYRHYRSPFEREEHLAWNDLVLPLDHPWWKTHTPQNGWGCKCRKFSVGERDLKQRGLKVAEDSQIPFNGETVEQTIGARGPNPQTVVVPRGIDPGFEHRPGDTTLGVGVEQSVIKTVPLPTAQGARQIEAVLARPRLAEALGKAFGEFVDRDCGGWEAAESVVRRGWRDAGRGGPARPARNASGDGLDHGSRRGAAACEPRCQGGRPHCWWKAKISFAG